MSIPARPKIYHIVHVDNLASIIGDDCLWSDSAMSHRQGGTVVGMGSIKQRRLQLPVSCHPNTNVGEYVPFYFCPRSIVLFVISRANHRELDYLGGQESIIHLEADLHSVVQWADENQRRWAFSLSNAGAKYAQFRSDWNQLGENDWNAVASNDFRNVDTKEAKQAEFLVHHSFPWDLVGRIGLQSQEIVPRVSAAMRCATHRPTLVAAKARYY